MMEFNPSENQQMLDKCCHLGFLVPKEQIETIFKVYGSNLEIFDNTGPDGWDDEKKDFVKPDPRHGWLMQKPEEGYPCDHLTPNGCRFELEGGGKPDRCKNFPSFERELQFIRTCSYKFQDGERVGHCNKCKVA